MPIDVERALEICEAATPGPWQNIGESADMIGEYVVTDDFEDVADCSILDNAVRSDEECTANATFIAHAREGYPAALRRIQDLETRLARMDKLVEKLRIFEREAVCPVNENLQPGFVSGAFTGWGWARNQIGTLLNTLLPTP